MSNKPKKNRRRPAASNMITRLEFSATHYQEMQYPSDMFYVGLANRLHPHLQRSLPSDGSIEPGTARRLAITLACYVEDLVSGTGVWAAFSSIHKRKYGRTLPFYNLRESMFLPYDEETPSFHAVLFLIWYELCNSKRGTVLNPMNPAMRLLAMEILPDLVQAYEDAPETSARPMLLPEETSGIPLFFQIRSLCAWLCDGCYLTRIHNREKATAEFGDFISKMFEAATGGNDAEAEAYSFEAFVPMNARIGPLAIPAYEWLAEIVDLYHEPEEEPYIPVLKAMKSRPYQNYRYDSVNGQEAVLRDLDGKKVTLSATSMPSNRFEDKIKAGDSCFMSIVLVDGVWVMNGAGLQKLPPDVFDDARKRVLADKKQEKQVYKRIYEEFGGRRIYVCGSYEEYLRKIFGPELPEAYADHEIPDDIRNADNVLCFLEDSGRVSMYADWGDCVKIEGNPYYDAEEASQEARNLILDHRMTSPAMRDYLIKKKLIPDAALNSIISPESGRKLFQQNMRFLNDFVDRDTMPFVESAFLKN